MTGLVNEYGEALYELARDEDLRDAIHEELMAVEGLIQAQPAFVRLLTSRAIPRAERLRVIGETFGGRVHEYVVSFMKLLVERERFDAFAECVRWFHGRYNEDFGIVEARVTAAVELPQARLDELRARLEEISGKRVDLRTRVDPAVIGGLRVEMDGRRYDNTIQSRLERLKQSLAESL